MSFPEAASTQEPMTAATARPSATRLAAWMAVLLLALYLVFVGGGWQGIYTATIRQVTVALAGLGLAAWAVVAVRRPEWRPRSVLLPAMAAMLTSLALSTALSRYPRFGVEYLGYAVLLAALYLLLVRLLADPFFRARFGALAVSLCGAISFAYLVLVLRHWIDWWALVGRITVPPLRPEFESLTFGNPSAVLTISLLFLIPAVAHLGTASTVRRAVVAGLIALVALVALFSGSRAGWLSIGLAVALVGGAWLSTAAGRATLRLMATALNDRAARVGIVAIALLGAVGVMVLAPALLRRLTEGGVELRTAFVAVALRMFADSPLVGTGPGTWVVQRVRYTVPGETDYYIPHAHDLYAQTLAELGLVGAAVGIVLGVALAWLIRSSVGDADPERRRWGWLAAFGLVYLGAHQVLDFYANMPAILFAAALPVAWLDATSPGAPRLAGRALPVAPGRLASLSIALAVIAAGVGLEWAELHAATHARAVALANQGDWEAAAPLAAQTAAQDPAWPPYQLTEGLAAARAGDHARAAEAFRRVVAADDLPEAWLDLAAEEASLGDVAGARGAIVRALRLGYQRPALAMPAGDLALRLGDAALAREAFVSALVVAPSLAGDPWWSLEPARDALFPTVREKAIERAGASGGWQIALVAGGPERARSLAAQQDAAAAARDAHIIAAWSGDASALTAVLDACAANPLDLTAVSWCARLEGRAGDVAAANRYRAWAHTVLGGSYVLAAELRVRSDDQVGRSDAGNPAIFYGHYTYRQPTPWDLLVPGLVHLTLE